ncbi:MAG: hypothetical protein A3E83_09155 [Gammaproteobacteria bacterium RIFCSPHIGHO2_12_FULL_41_20]|nr:MAG: hypothetical protein A3E83_09155 [Gammaproteobacteria bacterium RIFCSPHIGHO2_12_FULL_41_20]
MDTENGFSLFNAILDSAVLLDKNGKIVDWNNGAFSLFGYHKKEALGRSINFIYEKTHPFPKIIHETSLEEKIWAEDTLFIRKNGSKGTCKSCINILNHTELNKPIILLTHHPISAHKKTEKELQLICEELTKKSFRLFDMVYTFNRMLLTTLQALEKTEKTLHESEQQFHLLAQNTTDMISRHTPDGAFLYVSPASKLTLGYTPEDLIQANFFKLVHQDDFSKLKKLFANKRESQKAITYRIKPKEGDYRWLESHIRLVVDDITKSIREVQLASRDVTDQLLDKKARLRGQQLAHVYRLSTMEEMASGMAHEISQPLAAVINYTRGCVRYLENGHQDPAQLKVAMEKAAIQAERAGEIIQRLKNFFCKGQLIKTPCKINNIVRETITLIRHNLSSSKTKVDLDLDKDPPLVLIDKIQVQQVILNLLQNSMEAMQEAHCQEKRIYIETRHAEKNMLAITVNDTGPGFSKDDINKVFKPFFTTKAHGRGMGLAICLSIIEAHGGQFTIHPNTSSNSWIRFTLPVSQ